MTRCLTKTKSRPQMVNEVQTFLHGISASLMESGFLFTVLAILELALFLGYRHTTYHLAPGLALSKLYSNSMLAVCSKSRTTVPSLILIQVLNSRASFPMLLTNESRSVRTLDSTRMSFATGPGYHVDANNRFSPTHADLSSQATSPTRAGSYDPEDQYELADLVSEPSGYTPHGDSMVRPSGLVSVCTASDNCTTGSRRAVGV